MAVPEPLLAIHAALPGANAIPQGFRRLASEASAPAPAESATSRVVEYPLAALTVRVAEMLVLPAADPPPAPEQVRVNVLLPAPTGVTAWVPLVACVPLHAPLALQVPALVVDQLSVAD